MIVAVSVAGPVVNVGDGVSLPPGVTGVMIVTFDVAVKMIGVGETIPGVREGMGDQIGNGCGRYPKVSQPARLKIISNRATVFFTTPLYPA